ncbi:hypothetical protein IMG5_195340, partial [Ichthyophthirius multifiliis]
IKGQMNDNRKQYVLKAFCKFDSDNTGYIYNADIRGLYNCSNHPKVVKGEMTEEQVFVEFLQNFRESNKRNGRIEKQEWIDYYAAVSYSIQNDEHFIKLISQAWNI